MFPPEVLDEFTFEERHKFIVQFLGSLSQFLLINGPWDGQAESLPSQSLQAVFNLAATFQMFFWIC